MPRHIIDLSYDSEEEKKLIRDTMDEVYRLNPKRSGGDLIRIIGNLDLSDNAFAAFLLEVGYHMAANKRLSIAALSRKIFAPR